MTKYKLYTKTSLSKATLLLIVLVLTLIVSNLHWSGKRWKGIIDTDGTGYYAYLPAVFIYHDLNFGFFDQIAKDKYYNKDRFYDYRGGTNDGQTIDKYYVGTAIVEAPFFLLAHGLTIATGGDVDGYSWYYMLSVSIAALFYLFMGLVYLRKIMLQYKLSEIHTSLILLIAVFGTNLFYYSVGESSMSHVFSFAFIAAFVYFSKRLFTSFRQKDVLILAALLGMIVLIRPINILILASWPFLAGNFVNLKKGLRQLFSNFWNIALASVLFLCILFIQALIYKISTGQFFVYSYQSERFYFLKPHFIDILFSYRKGLFLYTPIYFIGALSILSFWKKSKSQLFAWLGFFVLITYVFSCWWMWYYGGSFSGRIYVEYIPLFMIPLGIMFSSLSSRWKKRGIFALLLGLVLLCQIQTYQYRYYIIHWNQMNKEKYWNVFLKMP